VVAISSGSENIFPSLPTAFKRATPAKNKGRELLSYSLKRHGIYALCKEIDHALAAEMHCFCCPPHAATVKFPLLPEELAASAHKLCCISLEQNPKHQHREHERNSILHRNTHQERSRAFCWDLRAELPATWNCPLPRSVTAGAVTPPRAPEKV
jgi:hypothetical protein